MTWTLYHAPEKLGEHYTLRYCGSWSDKEIEEAVEKIKYIMSLDKSRRLDMNMLERLMKLNDDNSSTFEILKQFLPKPLRDAL